jgi:Zinc dependent phospholipase C
MGAVTLRPAPSTSYNRRRMKIERIVVTASLAAVALVILAFPSDAQAWGPLAHLNFSAQALASLGVVTPGLRGVLQDFGNEFLYGSLAADIVVGKNMARYLYHCHNWQVGFNVFKHARPGGEQAFSLGFLSHLAADTVAHNYYVPFKTVASYHKTSTRHAYWELRYDQRMDKDLSRVARLVTTRAIRNHDDYLERMLYRSSVIPFGVSKQLFRSLLAAARIGRFGQVSRLALARERNLVLEPDLVVETNELAVRSVLGMLNEGERCEAARADATGARNIRLATDLRKTLKQRTAKKLIHARDAHEIAAETRDSFRRAIHGKLVLPPSIAKLAA